MGKLLVVLLLGLALAACERDPAPGPEPVAPAEYAPAAEEARESSAEARESESDRLNRVLADEPDLKARYAHRHPKETLEFFGIEPAMTVVEALPGGGWYSQILVPYLGSEGRLIGANYPIDIWPKLGFGDEAFLDSMRSWVDTWPREAEAWRGSDGATVAAFELGSMPASMEGQADAALLIRALHNLARFEEAEGYLSAALDDVHRALKPGGILGVVQHEARPDMPDSWANGENGYLKKQFVIDTMTAAGFELVDESDINENPEDQPTVEDVVWRLPPSYGTSRDNPELRTQMAGIGESNRMTLKFRKP